MKLLSTQQFGIALAGIAGLIVVMGLVHAFPVTPVYGAPVSHSHEPLQLSSVPIPFETLAAATPSNVWYTVTSSDGPFCVEGFIVSPGTPTAPSLPTGTVMIALVSIDSWGLSHPYITLFNGTTGGVSPLDIVLSYGNHICANKSITFQATEFQGGGPGTTIYLSGQAMVLAEPQNTITINGSTTQPE
jgi:hypothetical protein